ncbi:hypothetical protein [Micromonospora sp. WMMD812]|uniref:hypothetical protein n=1 Tax=Micromonospora sp. WMMD812 TaxID=3015152 RepID=UPI00248CA90B|nr:hypothetical protein [Micromonospora sp. WMMD812]WBB65210.1 hypothetical protein O7603_18530 [Micromonospora sp. WMMD812]
MDPLQMSRSGVPRRHKHSEPALRVRRTAPGTLRVRVDREVGQPSGEVLGDGGHVGQRTVTAQPFADAVDLGQGTFGAYGGLQQFGDLGTATPVTIGEGEQVTGVVEFVGLSGSSCVRR